MAFGCCAGFLGCFAFSNGIVGLAGTIVLPLYFSFYGPEAAVRFSLLLCVHSALLEVIPNAVKSVVPMLHLALFAVLLLLPINITPAIAVWMYEKLLMSCVPLVSVIEPVTAVLSVMFVSQTLVDGIEERPVLVKTVILGISGISYLFAFLIGYNLLTDSRTSTTESWLLLLVFVVSVMLLSICLLKEEGIISDVAVLSFIMTCILWATKQERMLSINPLEAPSQWIQSIGAGQSFLSVFLAMATTSLEHLGRAQLIFHNVISPTRLALAAVRVGSIVAFRLFVKTLPPSQESSDSWGEERESDSSKVSRLYLSPLFLRLAVIFVYTEVIIRSVKTTAVSSASRLSASQSSVAITVDQIFQAFFPATLFNFITAVRIWRILQLFIVVLAYVYNLFPSHDDYEELRW